MDTSTKPECWIDSQALADHLGFSRKYINAQAAKGNIPGQTFVNGKRTYWRFKISEVEAAMTRNVQVAA